MIMSSQSIGVQWEITEGKHLIGRGPQCDYLLDYDTVSREHAELELSTGGRALLLDKGSRNGTFINGRRLQDRAELRSGDIIKFGDIEFLLTASGLESANPFPEADSPSLTTLSMGLLTSSAAQDSAFAPRAIMAISDLGKMLVVPGSEKEMFDRAILLLRDIIPFGRAAIFIVGDESKLNLVSSSTSEAAQKEFNISLTVMDEVYLGKNAVLIRDTSTDARYANRDSIVAGGTRAAMAVPLLYEDRVLGVIYIDTSSSLANYTEDSVRVVAIFANILASKTVNFNFLRQLREKEALESEMAIASQIQRGLLPQNPPEIEGYHIGAHQNQCQQVGGDLYDIARLRDGRTIFVIADVSGKGTGAALLASNILASFRILYNTDNFSLLEAIGLVSDQFREHSRPGDFATLFAGILDPATGTIQYVNAGHNSPIVIRPNGGMRQLESSGMPIGLFKNQQWKAEAVEIERGDFLFAFTDGVTEGSNSQGEQFGEERLIALLREFRGTELSDLHSRLFDELGAFLADSPQFCDDITILFIERKS